MDAVRSELNRLARPSNCPAYGGKRHAYNSAGCGPDRGFSTASVLAAQDQAEGEHRTRAASELHADEAGRVGDRLRFTQLGTVLVIQLDGMAPVQSRNSPSATITRMGESSVRWRIADHQAENVRTFGPDRVYLLKTEVKDTGSFSTCKRAILAMGPRGSRQMPFRAALTFQYPRVLE